MSAMSRLRSLSREEERYEATRARLAPLRMTHALLMLSVMNSTGNPRPVSGRGLAHISLERTAARYDASASRNVLESCPLALRASSCCGLHACWNRRISVGPMTRAPKPDCGESPSSPAASVTTTTDCSQSRRWHRTATASPPGRLARRNVQTNHSKSRLASLPMARMSSLSRRRATSAQIAWSLHCAPGMTAAAHDRLPARLRISRCLTPRAWITRSHLSRSSRALARVNSIVSATVSNCHPRYTTRVSAGPCALTSLRGRPWAAYSSRTSRARAVHVALDAAA